MCRRCLKCNSILSQYDNFDDVIDWEYVDEYKSNELDKIEINKLSQESLINQKNNKTQVIGVKVVKKEKKEPISCEECGRLYCIDCIEYHDELGNACESCIEKIKD